MLFTDRQTKHTSWLRHYLCGLGGCDDTDIYFKLKQEANENGNVSLHKNTPSHRNKCHIRMNCVASFLLRTYVCKNTVRLTHQMIHLFIIFNACTRYSLKTCKLLNKSIYYDIRKYSFTARTINTWNSLPNKIVDAKSVNTFKTLLDKYWSDQPLMYDFKAELAGTIKMWYWSLV